MTDEIWSNLVFVHQVTKKHILLSEEIGGGRKMLLQPLKEQRDTLEHIVRIKNRELNPSGSVPEDDKYKAGQLHAALSHEVRAFFDVADYVGLLLRDEIMSQVSEYHEHARQAVIPVLYNNFAPRLLDLNLETADVRKDKDIGSEQFPLVREYDDILTQGYKLLREIVDELGRIRKYSQDLEARGDIQKMLEKYSRATITAALPNYYSKTGPRLNDLYGLVKGFMERVPTVPDGIPTTDAFDSTLAEIGEIRESVFRAVPMLDDLHEREKRSDDRDWKRGIAAKVIGGLLTALVILILGFIWGSQPESQDHVLSDPTVQEESGENRIPHSATSEHVTP